MEYCRNANVILSAIGVLTLVEFEHIKVIDKQGIQLRISLTRKLTAKSVLQSHIVGGKTDVNEVYK